MSKQLLSERVSLGLIMNTQILEVKQTPAKVIEPGYVVYLKHVNNINENPIYKILQKKYTVKTILFDDGGFIVDSEMRWVFYCKDIMIKGFVIDKDDCVCYNKITHQILTLLLKLDHVMVYIIMDQKFDITDAEIGHFLDDNMTIERIGYLNDKQKDRNLLEQIFKRFANMSSFQTPPFDVGFQLINATKVSPNVCTLAVEGTDEFGDDLFGPTCVNERVPIISKSNLLATKTIRNNYTTENYFSEINVEELNELSNLIESSSIFFMSSFKINTCNFIPDTNFVFESNINVCPGDLVFVLGKYKYKKCVLYLMAFVEIDDDNVCAICVKYINVTDGEIVRSSTNETRLRCDIAKLKILYLHDLMSYCIMLNSVDASNNNLILNNETYTSVHIEIGDFYNTNIFQPLFICGNPLYNKGCLQRIAYMYNYSIWVNAQQTLRSIVSQNYSRLIFLGEHATSLVGSKISAGNFVTHHRHLDENFGLDFKTSSVPMCELSGDNFEVRFAITTEYQFVIKCIERESNEVFTISHTKGLIDIHSHTRDVGLQHSLELADKIVWIKIRRHNNRLNIYASRVEVIYTNDDHFDVIYPETFGTDNNKDVDIGEIVLAYNSTTKSIKLHIDLDCNIIGNTSKYLYGALIIRDCTKPTDYAVILNDQHKTKMLANYDDNGTIKFIYEKAVQKNYTHTETAIFMSNSMSTIL